jgi:hypothetical protein
LFALRQQLQRAGLQRTRPFQHRASIAKPADGDAGAS